MPALSSRTLALASLTTTLALAGTGCVGLTPQLHPTDVESLERLDDREEREQAYADNAIYREEDARGIRYQKGQRVGARSRSWQSLDLILRSDRNSSAALPEKQLRAARVLTALVAVSSIVLVGGIAASARTGLDLSRLDGTGAVLLTGGLLTLGFGIGSGVAWGRAKAGYEHAVDIYNDSLALRLGLNDADGNYRPPEGVLVDEEGFIILDQKELGVPQNRPRPEPKPEVPAPLPIAPMPIDGPPSDAATGEGAAPSEGPQPAEQPAEQPASEPESEPASDAPPVQEPSRSLVGPSRS